MNDSFLYPNGDKDFDNNHFCKTKKEIHYALWKKA